MTARSPDQRELAGADRREAEATAEGVERSETTGAVPYPSMDEDLKGPRNIDGYGNEEEDAEGGGRSHGATCGTTGPDGRFIAGDEAARFWAKVEISSDRPDDCWLWAGGRTRDGYGRFRVIRDGWPTHVRAHRWAYEAKVGPTHGLPLDHRCRTRSCVNPDHLEAVSTRENARRVHQPGPASPVTTDVSKRQRAIELGATPETWRESATRRARRRAEDLGADELRTTGQAPLPVTENETRRGPAVTGNVTTPAENSRKSASRYRTRDRRRDPRQVK